MEPLLRIRHLAVRYGNVPVIQGLSLEIAPREFVGLTGPSGCGKSTLALTIASALPSNACTSGIVCFNGRAVAPVFQEPTGALHPMLRAGQQIVEAVRARLKLTSRECDLRARAALARLQLDPAEIYSAWPHQLSGGQRQRVLIAQALAAEPDLIVADEAVAALDDPVRAAALEALASSGAAVLFITHRPHHLAGFATRMLRMNQGTLAADAA